MTEEEGEARGEPSLGVQVVAGAELVLPPSCTCSVKAWQL